MGGKGGGGWGGNHPSCTGGYIPADSGRERLIPRPSSVPKLKNRKIRYLNEGRPGNGAKCIERFLEGLKRSLYHSSEEKVYRNR